MKVKTLQECLLLLSKIRMKKKKSNNFKLLHNLTLPELLHDQHARGKQNIWFSIFIKLEKSKINR